MYLEYVLGGYCPVGHMRSRVTLSIHKADTPHSISFGLFLVALPCSEPWMTLRLYSESSLEASY